MGTVVDWYQDQFFFVKPLRLDDSFARFFPCEFVRPEISAETSDVLAVFVDRVEVGDCV